MKTLVILLQQAKTEPQREKLQNLCALAATEIEMLRATLARMNAELEQADRYLLQKSKDDGCGACISGFGGHSQSCSRRLLHLPLPANGKS